jgi:hypothetical protein
MFKLAATVMGSVCLGLLFGTAVKGDPPTESAPRSSNQTAVIQRMIDASERESLKSVLDKLDDLERRIKESQSSTSTSTSTSSESDRPCPEGSLCPPESERDREPPCRPSACERVHDESVHEREWPCPGASSCGHERARHVEVHIYKHIYVHKPVYRHVDWRPRYYGPPYFPPPYFPPPWEGCDW